MEAKVGVVGVGRRFGQVGDLDADRDALDTAIGVRSGQGGELGRDLVTGERAVAARSSGPQRGIGVPHVEDGVI